MSDVAKVCGSLYASTITKTDINFFNKTIKFDLLLLEGENETRHTLEITDYKSFLWVEKFKTTHEEYDFKNWDYYELTSIVFGNVEANSGDRWLKQYPLDFNITIEIWESALLIKSNTVVVDGVTFTI
jgi:hypothetical protein